MRYCNLCLFPDTKPDLRFDDEGICDACRSAVLKDDGLDWAAQRRKLEEILEGYRSKDGSNYDCIVPVSGGKDSTYQTHFIKNELGLKPLCVCFTPCDRTELGVDNLSNLNKMGVDVIEVRRNPTVYNKLAREAFIRVGDPEWPEHRGIFTTQ